MSCPADLSIPPMLPTEPTSLARVTDRGDRRKPEDHRQSDKKPRAHEQPKDQPAAAEGSPARGGDSHAGGDSGSTIDLLA
jgi:hypothetical protein